MGDSPVVKGFVDIVDGLRAVTFVWGKVAVADMGAVQVDIGGGGIKVRPESCDPAQLPPPCDRCGKAQGEVMDVTENVFSF